MVHLTKKKGYSAKVNVTLSLTRRTDKPPHVLNVVIRRRWEIIFTLWQLYFHWISPGAHWRGNWLRPGYCSVCITVPPVPKSKNEWSHTSTHPTRLHGVVLS